MAQRELDLACLRQKVETGIEGAEWTRISWSSTGHELSVEIVDLGRSHMSTGVPTITVTHPDGTVVTPIEDRLEWDPHLRFFRYARTTADLADAYRNTILALEAILSSQSPPQDREGEKAWLIRALKAISSSGLDLERHAPDGIQDPVEHLVKELYEDQRHPLFHAKVGRRVTLPSPSSGQPDGLIDALQTLTNLYLAACASLPRRWSADGPHLPQRCSTEQQRGSPTDRSATRQTTLASRTTRLRRPTASR